MSSLQKTTPVILSRMLFFAHLHNGDDEFCVVLNGDDEFCAISALLHNEDDEFCAENNSNDPFAHAFFRICT